MSTPLDELFPGEREVDAPPAKPRRTVGQSLFTVTLVLVGSMLAGVVGSIGVGIVANLFGVGLDARYCNLETATTCSSVSVPAINDATGVGLPSSAVVVDSSWVGTGSAASLDALVESPEAGWTPPTSAYEACGAIQPCSGEVPTSFADRGIEVTAELVPRLDLGDGTQRWVFLGEDGDGREWVAVSFRLGG